MKLRNNMIRTFPNYLTSDSIFQKMNNFPIPWPSSISKSMDIAYFTMYSGIKLPSYFVKLNSDSNNVPNSTLIAQLLWDLYGKNWTHLWNGYVSDYNPIDNYNITENVIRDETDNRVIGTNGTLTSKVDSTGKETTSDSGESKLQHGHIVNDTRTINDFTYGFNSETMVPTAVRNETGNVTNTGTDVTTTTNTGEIDSESNSVRADTTSENTTDDDTINETISRDRKGNVGQNSYQELLRQEFELWKWNFFTQVFDDVDKVLCLSVFDPCSSSQFS